MNKRMSSIPLLVVVAAVALALGSLGTATAGGALSKGKVKKIATKVVNKAAPDLSVKSAQTASTASTATTATTATTASNATQLGGQPAAAYQNNSFRYRLPVQAAAADRVYSFPGLPAGKYLFTYNVVALGGAAGMYCYLRPTAANVDGEGYQFAVVAAGAAATSSSGIVDATATVNLRCNSGGGNFVIYDGANLRPSVTFTRIDTLTTGTSTAPRGTAASGSEVGLTR